MTNSGAAEESRHGRLMLILVLLTAGFGAALYGSGIMHRALEYDEIWTMQQYFHLSPAEIFHTLDTPNNHPLHTLFARTAFRLFGSGAVQLRLSAFLAGILLLAAVPFSAYRLSSAGGKWTAALTALFFPVFQAWLIRYASTARGYSMLTLFVFAMTACLLLGAGAKTRRGGTQWKLGAVLAALGAASTIVSGAVYCAAAGIAYLVMYFDWRHPIAELKRDAVPAAAGAAAGVLVIVWLSSNLAELNSARALFGENVRRPDAFFSFAAGMIVRTGLWLPLVCSLPGFFLRGRPDLRRQTGFVWILCGLTIAAALASNAGPDRTYLPLLTPAGFAAGLTFAALPGRAVKLRPIWIVCLALVLYVQNKWMTPNIAPVDWKKKIEFAANFPPDVYVVYPAGSGLEIRFNFPDILRRDTVRRLYDSTTFLAACSDDGTISGSDPDGFEQLAAVPGEPELRAGGFVLYRLRMIEPGASVKGDLVLVKTKPLPHSELKPYREAMTPFEPLLLNMFFNTSVDLNDDGGPPVMPLMMLLRRPPRTQSEWDAVLRGREDRAVFYEILSD